MEDVKNLKEKLHICYEICFGFLRLKNINKAYGNLKNFDIKLLTYTNINDKIQSAIVHISSADCLRVY